MKRLLNILLLLYCALFAVAQSDSVIRPMSVPVLLSGNFAELRSNHFHSGLDFKTQGAIGKPIYSIFDGSIVRAIVSPGGYGRAVYVKHNNGYMTVYAHLDKFIPAIAKAVREAQYNGEVFAVDLSFAPGEHPVKRGDIIGYSGNSGYSFGPHLHFELRSSDGEHLVNPMRYYRQAVSDNKAPVAYSLAVAPRTGCGSVNGAAESVLCRVVNGVVADTVNVWGTVGFSVKADDFMDNTRNKYGVYSLQLIVDDSLRFKSRSDEFPIADTRFINACVDYELYDKGAGWYVRTHSLPNNPLGFFASDNSKGWLKVDEERIYNVECRLADYHGNTSSCRVAVRGKRECVQPVDSVGYYLYWFMNNVVECDGARLRVPMGELFDNTVVSVKKEESPGGYSACYNFNDRPFALKKSASLSIELLTEQLLPEEKYYIKKVTAKGSSSVGGTLRDGWVTANISSSGCFEIDVDTVAPKLLPIKEKSWSRNGKIIFLLNESGSGLKSFKGYIDGRFVLFEYSSKSGRLVCDLRREKISRGKHMLELYVSDCAGNENVITKNIIYR
ncbi:MAG: M23 family metallopeptidase [Bacteroidaceae bacterium]|nr:M23 family metallopeptidase [Bacteroidaceae bacterium]